MTCKKDEPSKVEFLAGLVTGNASTKYVMASVQRSHRFPLPIFIQIENLARIGDVPVSLIINQLLECGLEALAMELPQEVAKQMQFVHKDQLDRSIMTIEGEAGGKKSPKLKPIK